MVLATSLLIYTFDHKLGVGREPVSGREGIAPGKKAGPLMTISMLNLGPEVRGQAQSTSWTPGGGRREEDTGPHASLWVYCKLTNLGLWGGAP